VTVSTKPTIERQLAEVKKPKPAVVSIATYEVESPAAGPRTVYRATFDIDVPRPSLDARIVVDPAAARFRGEFEAVAVLVTSLANGKGGVVVELAGPRKVTAVLFKGSSLSGKTVNLLRLDEDQPAPQPTVTAVVGGRNVALVTDEFIDARFCIAIAGASSPLKTASVGGVAVEAEPTGMRLGLLDPAGTNEPEFFWPTSDAANESVQADDAFAAALQAYFDARTADSSPTARVVIQSDQECRLLMTAFDTAASFAQDVFASPALRTSDLLDADALGAAIAAAGDPVSAYLKYQLGSADLVDGLNAVVTDGALYDAQRFADVESSPQTEAALASAADVPRLNRLLLQDAYPDLIAAPAVKRVLRFSGSSVSAGDFAIGVPAGAAVSKATIETQESVRDDRTADGELAVAAAERIGVHIGGDATTAAAVTIAEAISASGVSLPLLALATTTQVTVELQNDHNGAASGKALARGTATLAGPGATAWATVFFDPVVLSAGPAWLVVRAERGEAVWLAASDGDQPHVSRTDGDGAASEVVVSNAAPLFSLFTRSGAAIELPATVLRVNGTAVTAIRDGDRATYDITTAMQAALAESSGEPILLTLTSTVAGTVTVYPPHVEYAL